MKNDETESAAILAQWQTCVEMANSVSQRRDNMNNLFTTLNLAVIAGVTLSWNLKSLYILAIGIVVCILWLYSIRNYRLLNSEKFEVINSLEKHLPCQPFNTEWEKLKKNKKYKDTTKIEKIIPITFVILYSIAVVTIVINKIKAAI